MFEPLRRVSWPAVAAALAYGVIEWAALWRSRAADSLLGSLNARPRR